MSPAKQGWMSLILAALCMVAAVTVRSESWTNAAGHAIEAKLISLEDDVVCLQLPGGSSIRMPLASLSKSDQARACRAMGQEEIPASVLADFNQCRRTLLRLKQLRNTEALSDGEHRKRHALTLKCLRKACLREKLDEQRCAWILKQAIKESS